MGDLSLFLSVIEIKCSKTLTRSNSNKIIYILLFSFFESDLVKQLGDGVNI